MKRTSYPINGKHRYNIAGREPFTLPDQDIELPSPPEAPSAPSNVSLLTMILPPVIMVAGSLIMGILTSPNDLKTMLPRVLPMLLMGFGYPSVNVILNRQQKKKYTQAMKERQETYIKKLRESRSHIEGMIERQQTIMHEEFPNLQNTLGIGKAAGQNKRLWWRRPRDPDFLTLRLGTGRSPLSFSILPPRMLNEKDPLSELPFELLEKYEGVDQTPFLVDLKRVGSLALIGGSFRHLIRLARRLLVDVIVHHSPEDVNLILLANRPNAAEEWEWLKWTPHTHMLDASEPRQTLLFTIDKINSFLDDLKKIFLERWEQQKNYDDARYFGESYLVVMDDDRVRQHRDIQQIADEGWRVGVYLVFIGGANLPSSCRARVEIDQAEYLEYLETFQAMGSGNRRHGRAELARKSDVEPLARTLAGLEVIGSKGSTVLPSMVRVVDLIPGDPYSVAEIVERWRAPYDDSTQVMLPIGKYVDREGLSTYEIDFRPESLGGFGAYHAMMIGTTGSGKSIFMQSLVLAAAHRYSPRQINFMFMDFKAGAAELKKVSELPHSVGMVTDLSPELADRALQALENELSRRKQVFDDAGKITDVWDFNRRFPEQAFPQLVVMIDEFAEGIKILPNLVERLKELGRQGRAFGMYFFLANQEVNSAVEALKANVSWYVLLKVNRQEEMRLIGGRLPVPPGRGRGYIKVKSDVVSVQSAYAGLPAQVGDQESAEVNEYVITTFGPGGERSEIFRFDPNRAKADSQTVQSELELLMAVITEAAYTMNLPNAEPIYTEPLPPLICSSEVLACQELYQRFDGTQWVRCDGERNDIPLGFVDVPQQRLQEPFSINFNESGGHLWVIGSPGSGKGLTLLNLATALCLTHTPAEIHLYALEFGTGALTSLMAFPHTAAVIRGHETERLERLLLFLNEEMRQRTEVDWRHEGRPELYIFINNVADFRLQYQDQFDELGRFIRSGGAVGIHIILASNRGSEVPRSLSGNIIHRIVLHLPERQDYMDVLNTMVPPLTMRTSGRGYFAGDNRVAECQVAIPDSLITDRAAKRSIDFTSDQLNRGDSAKDKAVMNLPSVIALLGSQMRQAWKGDLPEEIREMADVLEHKEFEGWLARSQHTFSGAVVPLGLGYDNLQPFIVDVIREGQFWTVLGARQSGKSTAMIELAFYLRNSMPGNSRITLMPLRKGPFTKIDISDEYLQVVTKPDDMLEHLNSFVDHLQNEPNHFHVLLLDDLGIAFSGSNPTMVKTLNDLGDKLSLSPHENYLIVIADLLSNLKTSQTYASSFLKLFQQSQTGIYFSMEDGDMQWFNTRVNLNYKRSLKWLPGRGFFASKGNSIYIQCPFVMPGVFSEYVDKE